MATLAQVRDAISNQIITAIDALPEQRDRRLTAYPRVSARPNLPALVVMPATWTVEAMARGLVNHTLRILVLVSLTEYELAQSTLDAYLEPSGPLSFAGIIWADRTLGLPGTAAGMPALTAYGGQWDSAGIDHLGAEMSLQVHTRGDSGDTP
jgi:hypothetical protein